MYNSQYYTCEQIAQRLLQGYLDDYNTQTGQSLTKEQFLTKLGNVFAKENIIGNNAANIGYFVCDTANGTPAKVITAAGYELFQGGSIKVKFTNRNTALSATLNINGNGAKALYYGGNPVSNHNSWDNGEVVEIYYDGTSYYANNVEGNFKDGIFDISAYNLTEGQPTKYATLSEALGTNGNNIPLIFRKGGMQIKYVSTSDNKYVQYRLMTSKWSTIESDWERYNYVTPENIADEAVTTDKIAQGAVTTEKLDSELSNTIQTNTDAINQLFDIIKEPYAYGIEFDTEISSPKCTRIGNMAFHRTLPIQSNMRGCLLDDDGNVVEYLDPNDWTSNVRDGSKGQVMVEIPTHYRKFEEEGTKRRVLLSELPLMGYHKVPKCYVSAYEATVERSTQKLCSVANINEDYRGGNNNNSLDGQYNSFLGRPATSISRTLFRSYARKRKSGSTEWNCYTYDVHKTLFWLFVVEYATLNSQASYNSEPTSEGYRQGGLGAGVTTWDWGNWTTFNGLYPFVPCGHTDSLGNRTGVVSYTAKNDDESISKTFYVPRYRGVENPFGHIWKWTDGCNIQVSASQENGGTGLSKVFICHNSANFQDSNYANYSHVGNIDRVVGYIKEVLFGVGGEILPKLAGGGSTTYFCDNHYTNIPPSGEALRGLLFGGDADDGAFAGLASALSFNAPTAASAHFGSRLCFIPA